MSVINMQLKNMNVDQKNTRELYKALSEAFYNTESIEEDNRITTQLLCLIRDFGITKEETKMLLKGITKHIEHFTKEFRENGLILTSCIFKYKGFKIENMINYEFYKELILSILGKNETEKQNEEEHVVPVLSLTKKHKFKYLKPAIEILRNNKEKKFEDVFDNLVELIKKSSDRTLKQSKEYLRHILTAEYDSFEKIKAISLLIVRQESLLQYVLDEIFDLNFNVKNKVDLIFVLIMYIETSVDCNYKYILQQISENKNKGQVHKLVEKYLDILINKLTERL